ncbi:MAG: AAA family ATPase [Cyanobacteria bacterium]|nr:AAA family ATPase [Cyanobacteriota bacterium]
MFKEIKIKKFRLFENQDILLGKRITVFAGENMTGKSTLLGMLANSSELKKKDGFPYICSYSLRIFKACYVKQCITFIYKS